MRSAEELQFSDQSRRGFKILQSFHMLSSIKLLSETSLDTGIRFGCTLRQMSLLFTVHCQSSACPECITSSYPAWRWSVSKSFNCGLHNALAFSKAYILVRAWTCLIICQGESWPEEAHGVIRSLQCPRIIVVPTKCSAHFNGAVGQALWFFAKSIYFSGMLGIPANQQIQAAWKAL